MKRPIKSLVWGFNSGGLAVYMGGGGGVGGGREGVGAREAIFFKT